MKTWIPIALLLLLLPMHAAANLIFTKAFLDDPAAPGDLVTLEYTLINPDPESASDLSFSDDLSSVLPGLVAIDTPLSGVVGPGSVITTGPVVTMTNGILLPMGGHATFFITVYVPPGTTPGIYPSISSELYSGGLVVVAPAMDTLTIIPEPGSCGLMLLGMTGIVLIRRNRRKSVLAGSIGELRCR